MLGSEPVAIMAVIRSGIILAILLFMDLTDTQIAAILVFVEALFGLVTRSQVSPTE